MVNKTFTLTLVYNPYTLVRCISTIELVSYLVSKVQKGTKIADYVPKQVGR